VTTCSLGACGAPLRTRRTQRAASPVSETGQALGRAEGRIVRVLERAAPNSRRAFSLWRPRQRCGCPTIRACCTRSSSRPRRGAHSPTAREAQPVLTPKHWGGASHAARARRPEQDAPARTRRGGGECRADSLPREGGVAPAGRVVEILGRPGEFGVDVGDHHPQAPPAAPVSRRSAGRSTSGGAPGQRAGLGAAAGFCRHLRHRLPSTARRLRTSDGLRVYVARAGNRLTGAPRCTSTELVGALRAAPAVHSTRRRRPARHLRSISRPRSAHAA